MIGAVICVKGLLLGFRKGWKVFLSRSSVISRKSVQERFCVGSDS